MACSDMNRSRQRVDTPRAIEDCHALLGWMLPQLDKFPRTRDTDTHRIGRFVKAPAGSCSSLGKR